MWKSPKTLEEFSKENVAGFQRRAPAAPVGQNIPTILQELIPGVCLQLKGSDDSQAGIFASQKGSSLGIPSACRGLRMGSVGVRCPGCLYNSGVLEKRGWKCCWSCERGRNGGKTGIQPWRDPGVEQQCLGEHFSRNLQLLFQLSGLFFVFWCFFSPGLFPVGGDSLNSSVLGGAIPEQQPLGRSPALSSWEFTRSWKRRRSQGNILGDWMD